MTSTDFPLMADGGPDDLPRTLRREREVRERAAREREAKARAATLTHDFGASDDRNESTGEAVAAAVTRFDVPFFHLVFFFLKAVFAAIPALIVLGVLVWFAGALLKALYPQLLHMQILIQFPN